MATSVAAPYAVTAAPTSRRRYSHKRSSVNVRASAEPAPASCPTCGVVREKMKCDGSGRQQGGIGAIPGFTWWPIKAYRPCPTLVENGGTYNKKGQDIDEVLFGSKK